MSDAQRVANMAERATLETMMERIAALETPNLVKKHGPKAVDGFQLGILAACTVLSVALKEVDNEG